MTKNFNRRGFLKQLSAAGAAVSLSRCGAPEQAAEPEKRPNILFVFDDQFRADACGVYGGRNIETPHIDRLASQGVRFGNAWSTYPLCTPYRGMLQTGRYPTHSGIFCNWTEVNPNQRCVAHVFADGGYQTGFIGKWHLAAGLRKHTGLYEPDQARTEAYRQRNPHHEFVPPGPGRLGYQHWEAFNFHVDFNNYWFYRDEPEKIFSGKYETDTEIDQAIAYMEQHGDDAEPFFLMVAPHPPHPPFRDTHNPAGYLEQIPEELHWSPNVPEQHPRRQDPFQARCYYSMCKNMDDNLGRLMDYLDRSGLAENTILVFTSDHGEQHGSHNRINKMAPYNESVNVPLIVRWPGHIAAGSVRDDIYTCMDHFPTLCALAGLSAPETAEGVDLSDAVLGKGKVDRQPALMMNYVSHWDYFQTQTNWPEWRGVRDEQFTYVKWLSGEEELFDNLEDPFQMRNLASGRQDLPRLERMQAQMKQLMADAHDEFLPGTAYAEWFDEERNLVRTALGPVPPR